MWETKEGMIFSTKLIIFILHTTTFQAYNNGTTMNGFGERQSKSVRHFPTVESVLHGILNIFVNEKINICFMAQVRQVRKLLCVTI